jgi:hypothetical protein
MIHRIPVFGEPLDDQLRQLGELMSYKRLCDWFEQHWSTPARSFSLWLPLNWRNYDATRRNEAGRNASMTRHLL